MDLQLQGKRALASGASQGIGRAIALGLAREGVQVAAVARRKNLLDELSAEIVSVGYVTRTVIPVDGGMSRFAF